MTIAGSLSNRSFPTRYPGGAFAVQDASINPGKVFWVGSNVTGATDSASYGKTPAAPFATLDYAVGQCTAQRGDTIYVLPKHAETVTAAAGLAFDIEGITVQGLGNGDNKPTVTLGTADSADVDVDAKNITVRGLRFVCSINDLVHLLDVNEEYFVCEDCDFVSSSAKECWCFVDIATTKDHFTFRGCTFYQPSDPEGTDAAATTGCFYFVDSEHILMENCSFIGNFETAIFHNRTTAAKYVFIRNCYGIQSLSGGEIWTQVAAMSGGCDNSLFITVGADDATEAKICGTCSANFYVGITTGFGNDGGGGQLAISGAAAAT